MPNADSAGPPLLLALETATTCGSVALIDDGRCLAEFSLATRPSHSRRLLAGIDRLLQETQLGWRDLTAIAVSLGPGSFTGLRIGLATAKGLCFATGKPLIGVPTLEGLACQLPFAGLPICPVVDARKNEVYAGFYRCNQTGALEQTGDFLVLSPERLVEKIHTPTIFVGDAVPLYGELFRARLQAHALLAPPEICFARAAAIGFAAQRRLAAGILSDPVASVPIYVRASDAELQLGRKTNPQA
ncbi:tRNA (adenosine(37)-N6)-threonylcarbamoyltransferase complex dimerization subunit type 1 TsaB [Thiovibrio sp. JS02]